MSRPQIGVFMANDDRNDRERTSNQNGQGSQDAQRHQKDAVHHKVPKGRSDEEVQPETPKVESRTEERQIK
jgi:hypothetical protein